MYGITKIYERTRVTGRPDCYRTENITVGRFTGADICRRKRKQFIDGNVCSPLQVRSYVFLSIIRARKRSRLSARRISPKRRSSINTALARARAQWKRIGAIWKRSIFVRVASSKNAARSLTGARRLNWIDIMKTTYVYIMLLGESRQLMECVIEMCCKSGVHTSENKHRQTIYVI